MCEQQQQQNSAFLNNFEHFKDKIILIFITFSTFMPLMPRPLWVSTSDIAHYPVAIPHEIIIFSVDSSHYQMRTFIFYLFITLATATSSLPSTRHNKFRVLKTKSKTKSASRHRACNTNDPRASLLRRASGVPATLELRGLITGK